MNDNSKMKDTDMKTWTMEGNVWVDFDQSKATRLKSLLFHLCQNLRRVHEGAFRNCCFHQIPWHLKLLCLVFFQVLV